MSLKDKLTSSGSTVQAKLRLTSGRSSFLPTTAVRGQQSIYLSLTHSFLLEKEIQVDEIQLQSQRAQCLVREVSNVI